MTAFIGIDLGTTFSVVATIDESGRPVIVHNSEGSNLTPSCVYENDDGNLEVGEEARREFKCEKKDERSAGGFKRDMGESKIYKIKSREFTPTELSTLVLKKLIKDASKVIGEIGEAVVTIPANFSTEAREATMVAAKAAGLNTRYIINEPTAAALYYSFKHGEELHGNYAVYDLGGGTFDISIIRVAGQDVKVLASNGIPKLGGEDFDRKLQEVVDAKYKEITGSSVESGDFSEHDAEQDKISLSARKKVMRRVNHEGIDISREHFEESISTFIYQAEMVCEKTVEEAKLEISDIKAVLLAGGSTRIPLVHESIKRVFKQDPVSSANVDEVVALGAALYAAYKGDQSNLSAVQRKSLQRIKVVEATAKCFGTISLVQGDINSEVVLANVVLIHKGEKIPCSVAESFYTTQNNQESVRCTITESTNPEKDLTFVNIIWEGELALPSGRPQGQEIKVTFSYDDNQIMKCSFVDVGTGKETKVDLSMTASKTVDHDKLDKLRIE